MPSRKPRVLRYSANTFELLSVCRRRQLQRETTCLNVCRDNRSELALSSMEKSQCLTQ